MKQEENELTIEEIYSFLHDDSQKDETAESKLDTTTMMVEKYRSQQQEKIKKTRPAVIFLFVMLISIMAGGAYCAVHWIELKEEKELTDQLFRRNESGGISYRVKNNHPVSYQDLMEECDSLYKELHSTQNKLFSFASSAINTGAVSVDYNSWTCEPNKVWINAKKIITDKNGNYLIYQSSDGHIITFEEVMSERDSLYALVNYYKLRLTIADKKYGMKIIDTNGRPDVVSERVDSALQLLPYYRDRIERTKEGYWAVHTFSNK